MRLRIMPNILCIETSIGKCSVALQHNGIEDYIETKQSFMQSELLFVLIQELLKKNSLEYKDFDIFACTLGPGSFTGIRIGIAAVRGIKKILPDIQLLGVSTLEVMASDLQFPVVEEKILAVLNASGGDLYAQEFSSNGFPFGKIYSLQKKKLENKRKGSLLVVEQSSFYYEQGLTVNLTARSLLRKALKIISERKQEVYRNIQPIYVKDPNITTKILA